ncbi:DUF551 domain-containing protein [Pseudomonas sp. NPDC087358]|uniref:DUF551 domain-containing protein n=1 Tax=Pseudomonas sp. NPDC087358 TaxID=3364439 RepID=UPI003850C57B
MKTTCTHGLAQQIHDRLNTPDGQREEIGPREIGMFLKQCSYEQIVEYVEDDDRLQVALSRLFDFGDRELWKDARFGPPKPHTDVLVYCNGEQSISSQNGDGLFYSDEGEILMVTHWQPLPKPPQSIDGEQS